MVFTNASQRLLSLVAVMSFLPFQLGFVFPVSIGSIQTSVLELVAILIFLVVLSLPVFHRCFLWKWYILLLCASAIPLVVGVSAYGCARALRSYQWVVFPSVIFLSIVFSSNHIFSRLFLKGIFITTIFLAASLLGIHYVTDIDLTEMLLSLRFFALYGCFYGIYRCLDNSSSRLKRCLYAGACVIALMTILSVRTRAFYLGFGVGMLIFVTAYIAGSNRRRLWKAIFVAVVFSAIVSLVSYGIPVLDNSMFAQRVQTFGCIDEDITAVYRLQMWTTAWETFVDNKLFGVGFGRYLDFDPIYFGEMEAYDAYPPQMMHNSWLEILYSGGLMSAISVVLMHLAIVGHMLRAYSRRRNESLLMIVGLMAAYSVVSFFGGTLSSVYMVIPYWSIVGLVLGGAIATQATVKAR